MAADKEWSDYRITFPDAKEQFGRPVGRGLDTVHHIVHVPVARRILEDGRLRAGLIYDESRLKKSRISVTWLSANRWTYGSIYGNVQFSFSWKKLQKDQRFYWVERMTQYSPPAYRILLTDRDLSNTIYAKKAYVRPYSPLADKGPLRERKGEWFWNGELTSEFMIEADIGLEDCTALEFISHHKDICRPHGSSCKDCGRPAYHPAGKVLAFILGCDMHDLDHVLDKSSQGTHHRLLAESVDDGIDGIRRALGGQKKRFGGTLSKETSRKAVLRGALALYGSDQTKAARELVALLKSQSTFDTALT